MRYRLRTLLVAYAVELWLLFVMVFMVGGTNLAVWLANWLYYG